MPKNNTIKTNTDLYNATIDQWCKFTGLKKFGASLATFNTDVLKPMHNVFEVHAKRIKNTEIGEAYFAIFKHELREKFAEPNAEGKTEKNTYNFTLGEFYVTETAEISSVAYYSVKNSGEHNVRTLKKAIDAMNFEEVELEQVDCAGNLNFTGELAKKQRKAKNAADKAIELFELKKQLVEISYDTDYEYCMDELDDFTIDQLKAEIELFK